MEEVDDTRFDFSSQDRLMSLGQTTNVLGSSVFTTVSADGDSFLLQIFGHLHKAWRKLQPINYNS